MARRPPDHLQLEAMDRAEAHSAARWTLRRRLLILIPVGIAGLVTLWEVAWFLSFNTGDVRGAWFTFGFEGLVWSGFIICNIVIPAPFVRVLARLGTVREENLDSQRGYGTPPIPPWPPKKDER